MCNLPSSPDAAILLECLWFSLRVVLKPGDLLFCLQCLWAWVILSLEANNLVIRHRDSGVWLPVLLNPGSVIGYETVTNYSTSLYLSFLICKKDLIIAYTSLSCYGFLWIQMLSRLTGLFLIIIKKTLKNFIAITFISIHIWNWYQFIL